MKRFSFTLIELLTVIGIIGVLAALLIPAVGAVKSRAQRASCGSNLHQIGIALRLYIDENGGFLPTAAQMPSTHVNEDPPITVALDPYVEGSKDLFRCSADSGSSDFNGGKAYWQTETSSYEYSGMMSGRKLDSTFLTSRWGEGGVMLMHDYESFHGKPNSKGAMNYLFADGRVGDLVE